MKPILCFLAGVAVGSAATYLAVKGYFEEKAEQRIQEEVNSVKEAYLKRAAAKTLADKNTEEKRRKAEVRRVKVKEVSDEELSPDPSDPEEKKVIREIRRIRKNYDGGSFEREDEPVEDSVIHSHNIFDDQDDFREKPPSEGLEEAPYPITASEFANEMPYYDKITIYLFRDDVAVDEEERVVDDLEQLVGVENLGRLGDLSDDEGVVLIRNEIRSADYEIRLMDEDYIPDSGIPVRDK